MDFKDLPALVLGIVLVGILVGMGVLIFDKFAIATAESESITNESFTTPALNGNVSLNNGNLTSITAVHNGTAANLAASNYTFYTGGIGKLSILDNTTGCRSGATCYVSYVYTEYGTETSKALGSARSAVGGIATSWLALIVTISVLAILLVLVIRSFRVQR